MRDVHVVGAGMIRFGKYPPDVTLEVMGVGAAREAMASARAAPADIEAVYVGHVFGGPASASARGSGSPASR